MYTHVHEVPPVSQIEALYKPIQVLVLKDGTASPLQRFLNSTIDLDKIVQIHDPSRLSKHGYVNSSFVGFQVRIVDEKVLTFEWSCTQYTRFCTNEEAELAKKANPKLKIYGAGSDTATVVYYESDHEQDKQIVQIVVDDLTRVWRMYKEKVLVEV